MAEQVLALDDVYKSYGAAAGRVDVLQGASAEIAAGEAVALVAPSGTGKSTLLHIAGLLESPDRGRILINGVDCSKLGDEERTRRRRDEIGFVYQFHHLLPELTARENLIVPQLIRGLDYRTAGARADELMSFLGVDHRAKHRPSEMSGGERQRVAIARAVANAPRLLLADEPTGNLDPHTSERVFGVLMQLVRASGLAAVFATHNIELAGRMDRVLTIKDGRVAAVRRKAPAKGLDQTPEPAAENSR